MTEKKWRTEYARMLRHTYPQLTWAQSHKMAKAYNRGEEAYALANDIGASKVTYDEYDLGKWSYLFHNRETGRGFLYCPYEEKKYIFHQLTQEQMAHVQKGRLLDIIPILYNN